ncbi:Putative WD-repeat family protein [Giardia duodenalis]|uniref:Putative WD-repeat family protein n=1 Tax=Giardia intestinalis TaxID=5741 RepID=V6TLU0_GIAIN|nr:Putative WD-repeat family protein [Giardia intestinalis]
MSVTLATSSPGGSLMLWDPKGPIIYWQTTYSEGEPNSFAYFGTGGCVSVRTKPNLIYLFTYENTAPKFKFTAPFDVEIAMLHGRAEGCDADYLLLCGTSGQLGIWNLTTGALLGIVQLHSRTITALDIWQNYLVTGSKDGTVSLWSFSNILTAIYTNKSPQQIALNADHAFPLVFVRFDKFVRSGDITLYSMAEKGHLRRWRLVEASRGFKLEATMSLLAPDTPVSLSIGPTGTVLYLLTAKTLYSVTIGGPDLSSTLLSLRDAADNGTPIKKVLDIPETLGDDAAFTALDTSPVTQTVLLGLSTGQIMALFPGGGFQIYRNKESLPVKNMTILPHNYRYAVSVKETKQTSCMQMNLSRTPSLKQELTEEWLKKAESDGYSTLSFGQLHKETPLSLAPLGLSPISCTTVTMQCRRDDGLHNKVAEPMCSLSFLQEELGQLSTEDSHSSKAGSHADSAQITTATRVGVSPEEHMALIQRNLELEAKLARLTAHVSKAQLISEGGYY